jgi:hypothetical protein
MTTHPGAQYLAEQLQAAYDKVKEWPENSETGFMDLISLRNLVPDAIDLLASEKARADAAEEECRKARIAMNGAIRANAENKATIASLTEQLAEAREGLARMENCCEQLAATRSTEIYTAMIDGGQAQALLDLDNARRNARATLSRLEKQEGEA